MPVAAPGPDGQHLDHRIGEGPVGEREAESTVAWTDSVESRTAPTRSISVAAWSTTRWASATRGTVWRCSSSAMASTRRISRRRPRDGGQQADDGTQAGDAATRTAISPADMILGA